MTTIHRPEPLCCGTPMVHNSWTGQYECADAYFTLVDDHCGGYEWVALERLTAEDVGPDLADALAHWRGSRISDAPSEPAPGTDTG